MSEETLRNLIRYLGPLTVLRQDLEQTIHLELHSGVGAAAARTYEGLRAAVARLVDDPYLDALVLDAPAGADDRQKVALVLMLSGQLLALVQSQVGLASVSGAGAHTHIQSAPHIVINAQGAEAETARSLETLVERALGLGETADDV